MQLERAPVLRFTVGASILFVLSMLTFGRLILETRAKAEAARQHEMAERRQMRIEEEALDARIEQLERSLDRVQRQLAAHSGCQLGKARQELRMQEARASRDAAQARLAVLRCHQQPGCTVSP